MAPGSIDGSIVLIRSTASSSLLCISLGTLSGEITFASPVGILPDESGLFPELSGLSVPGSASATSILSPGVYGGRSTLLLPPHLRCYIKNHAILFCHYLINIIINKKLT